VTDKTGPTPPAPSTTTGPLLDTLRSQTGRGDLDFAGTPRRLTGGFWAEMVRFSLADPPDGLGGQLVARIVPDPAVGAWEATMQRAVADQGFPTPRIRLLAPADGPLGRYLIVMDHVDGRPPLEGLSFSSMVSQIPTMTRRLPDELADITARLHRLDPGPVLPELEALDAPLPLTTAAFVQHEADMAAALGRDDLSGAAERLIATEPSTTTRVICHGDLHPFNLLLGDRGPVLVDWSVSRVAHPAFDIAFTDLLVSNAPIELPRPLTAGLHALTRRMATRFVARYRALMPDVDLDHRVLGWHRQVHALRSLVELAGWDATGTRPADGHPWITLEPRARAELGLAPHLLATP
jgi:aminoglycoside phosphotransferase (APT) family kinase protein